MQAGSRLGLQKAQPMLDTFTPNGSTAGTRMRSKSAIQHLHISPTHTERALSPNVVGGSADSGQCGLVRSARNPPDPSLPGSQ